MDFRTVFKCEERRDVKSTKIRRNMTHDENGRNVRRGENVTGVHKTTQSFSTRNGKCVKEMASKRERNLEIT